MFMKQIYLIVYLESKGCEEVKVSNKGYYIMRNLKNGKMSGVPVPSNGDFLKEETICNVCNCLGVETPPSTENGFAEVMGVLKEEVAKRIGNNK